MFWVGLADMFEGRGRRESGRALLEGILSMGVVILSSLPGRIPCLLRDMMLPWNEYVTPHSMWNLCIWDNLTFYHSSLRHESAVQIWASWKPS